MNGGVLPDYIGSRGEHHWRVYGSLVTFYFFKFLGQGRGRRQQRAILWPLET